MTIKPFRAFLLFGAATVLTLLLPVPSPLAEVSETSKIAAYPISGNTVEEVRQQMILNGPKMRDTPMGSHIAAMVRWRFRTQMVRSMCIIPK